MSLTILLSVATAPRWGRHAIGLDIVGPSSGRSSGPSGTNGSRRAPAGAAPADALLAVLGDDGRVDAAPDVEHALDAGPARANRRHQIVEDRVRHRLVERAPIAERPEV